MAESEAYIERGKSSRGGRHKRRRPIDFVKSTDIKQIRNCEPV